MPPPLERLRALVPFLTAIVFGGLLRLWHLDAQVMGDDEWNAVGVAIKQPLPEILATFQVFDSSIPLTALFRFAMDHGVRLGEMAFRLPSLAASLALLCLAPAWVARRLGRPVAITFAWLLAASPLLVLYGRIARSYLPMTALAFAAVAAFDGWWREPSWRRGLAFSACAALAAWFHLGASTLVVSPFLFAGVALARRWDLRRAVATGGLAVATAAAFLLFLLPGRESLAVLIANKHQRLLVSLSEAARTAALLAGSRFGPVVAAFWVAAIAGLILLARRDRRLAGISGSVLAGHTAGLLFLAPAEHENALVLTRYLVVALPWLLLWVAAALSGFGGGSRRKLLAAGGIAGLFLAGPFLQPSLRWTSFAHHWDHLAFVDPRPRLPPNRMPRFYRWLGENPGSAAVVEYPWFGMWRVSRIFYLCQEVHRRDVLVATARPWMADRRLAMRNLVAADPAAILASRAGYLVVHRDLGREEARLPELPSYPQARVVARFAPRMRNLATAMANRLRREWGDPDWYDRRVLVWDLARVRRETFNPGAQHSCSMNVQEGALTAVPGPSGRRFRGPGAMNSAFSPGESAAPVGRPQPRDSRFTPEDAGRHPEPRQLARLMSGDLPQPEMLAAIRHLLAGCPRCAEVTRRIWQLGERMPRRGPGRPSR